MNIKMYKYIDKKDIKEFIYQLKKVSYKKYIEEYCGMWDEDAQRKYFEEFIDTVKDDTWIIQLDGNNIGFFNGETLKDGGYGIGNICILKEYQRKGIGSKILKDIIDAHKDQDIYIQCFKSNPVISLYKRLGFKIYAQDEVHYKLIIKR